MITHHIGIALPTRREQSLQFTRVDSMLPPPHRPTGRRLPNASLTRLAGGIFSNTEVRFNYKADLDL